MRIPLSFFLVFLALATQAGERRGFLTGVDANYSRELAAKGAVWKIAGRKIELFPAFRKAGVDSVRVRVWTGQTGPSGLDYAVQVATSAQKAGMKPYLVFFLNDNWADYVKQPAPASWAGLPLAEKLRKVTAYSEATARAFQRAGVKCDLYEIGNEIDFGICGEFEEDWGCRFDILHMETQVWNRAAQVILAAEQGIRAVNPHAKFMLHLTQWWNPDYCTTFARVMRAGGVQLDYVGLTFYPSSGLCPQQQFTDLGVSIDKIYAATRCPVIICEYAYPSQASFGGQFSTWNHPVESYPLDEDGQRRWATDFLAYCRGQQHIMGAFYWSPEWYNEDLWPAFALFRADGEAKPALRAFQATPH